MKKYMAFLGSAMFFVVCLSLYLMLETTNMNSSSDEQNGMVMSDFGKKMKGIEDEIKENQEIIGSIKKSISDLSRVNNEFPERKDLIERSRMGSDFKKSVSVQSDTCAFVDEPPDKTQIQMLNVYESMAFENVDGGAWKQGWDVKYDSSQWQQRQLRVFLVPHSHNDPGWLKTLEKYYSDQTRHILNLMVEKLEEHKEMTFIYAEMAFFTIWWNEIDSSMKERTKKLLKSGRLEIVTGGWVMNDEANSHYFAMVDQMLEGNQWLHNQLGITPKSGWAIDPFGHSSTMAYLLKEMGFENMLIQRTHYSVKKELSKKKQLEFMWRQNWDAAGKTDMFCHMMPFYSYDVPHTCGPDPKICCQFDFKRLPGGKISCPWHVPPQPITPANVASRAELLLDQYRKKATLYDTGVVLIPLGDDFRYDRPEEWDNQYTNYKQLFDYMNQQHQWNVHAQFGTLSDYFDAVHERKREADFPVLSGDFFTYADRDDHYWSGYYTSRPFYKVLDRILEAHLRGAELLLSAALAQARRVTGEAILAPLMRHIVEARRSLGLYQHHDGITGTAKDHVVADYGQKHLHALTGVKQVLAQAAEYVLLEDKAGFSTTAPLWHVDETRETHDALPRRTVISLAHTPQPVAFYNSLTHGRTSVVRVHTDCAHVEVTDPRGHVVRTQVDPYWIDSTTYSTNVFKVSFEVTVPGVGLSKYSIRKTEAGENPLNQLAKIIFLNAPQNNKQKQDLFEVLTEPGSLVLENADLRVSVNKYSGCMESVTLQESGQLVQTSLSFLSYGTTSQKDKSGAYLFMPNGQAKALPVHAPAITITQGPVMSEMTSDLPLVKHRVRLYNTAGADSLAVDVLNTVDLRGEHNKELVMRIETDVHNTDHQFYTDLNGFQMIQRKWFQKIPIQANFYPMPSAAYIEDSEVRVSLLSAQSLGAASLRPGWLEVVQDRRLNQDDNRGVGQGVLDNKLTNNRFRLVIEKRDDGRAAPTQPAGYLSTMAHLLSHQLAHPLHMLPKARDAPTTRQLASKVSFVQSDLPCDLHLLNLRTEQAPEQQGGTDWRPAPHTALILHRTALDCSFPTKAVTCRTATRQVTFEELLAGLEVSEAQATSLSLLHEHNSVSSSEKLKLMPMQLQAYRVRLQ